MFYSTSKQVNDFRVYDYDTLHSSFCGLIVRLSFEICMTSSGTESGASRFQKV